MMHFCTVSDKNYLLKALAMHKSLRDTIGEDFILHWLCLDEETFDAVHKIKDRTLNPISLSALENIDSGLVAMKENPHPSGYGNKWSWFCWSITPYWTNFVMKVFVPENNCLCYVDSDIVFYKSPRIIIDAVGVKSVGIHTHRFGGEKRDTAVGWYNCGVVVFKNDEPGRRVSELWKRCLLSADHEWYQNYGSCGDQKYLEVFVLLFPEDVYVFDVADDILHGAGWCTHGLNESNIHFYHFSHFRIDDGQWRDSLNGEWNPSGDQQIRPLYEKYFSTMCDLSTLHQIPLS